MSDSSRNGTISTAGGPAAKATAQEKYIARAGDDWTPQLTGRVKIFDGGIGHHWHEFEHANGRWQKCGGLRFCKLCLRMEAQYQIEQGKLQKRLQARAAAKRAAKKGD